jgi:hypothetical protein
MKKVLLLSLAVVMVASMASAQGFFGIYSDADTYSDCNLDDSVFGLCSVYLVQHFANGISSQMMVVDDSGLTPTGQTIHTQLSIGGLFTGIDFSYGACLGPTILLATLNYFCQDNAPACGEIYVAPHPQTGQIVLVDCSPAAVETQGGLLTVNSDGCPCTGGPNAVEESSWGQIKALYTD